MFKEEEARDFIKTWGNDRLRNTVDDGSISNYNHFYQLAMREEYEFRFGGGGGSFVKPGKKKLDIKASTKYSEKTNEIINKIASKIKTIEREDIYMKHIEFQSGHKGDIVIKMGDDPKKSIINSFQRIFPEMPREHIGGVLRKFVEESEIDYADWVLKQGEKKFFLSKNLQFAVNELQRGDVEFGGYVEDKPKQELHLVEGEEHSVCTLKPKYGGVSFHTHPQSKARPSTADLKNFLTCPNQKTSMIIGKDGIFVAKKMGSESFENIGVHEINDLINAIADDKGISYHLLGGNSVRLDCMETSGSECEKNVDKLYEGFYDSLKDIFNVAARKYERNDKIELLRKGGSDET